MKVCNIIDKNFVLSHITLFIEIFQKYTLLGIHPVKQYNCDSLLVVCIIHTYTYYTHMGNNLYSFIRV